MVAVASPGAFTGRTAAPAAADQKEEPAPIIHVPIPLDVELFHLQYPDNGGKNDATDEPKDFALVGSFESGSWEGLKILGNQTLGTPDGRRLHYYPQPLIFRVTASLHPPHLEPDATNTSKLDAPIPVDDLLSRLRFVLRINHNLHQWLHPISQVRNIGPPLNDTYPERTFEIVYDPRVPIPLDDVVCLDVYGPDGTHLAKFYLPAF